jgi:hypothetical protein
MVFKVFGKQLEHPRLQPIRRILPVNNCNGWRFALVNVTYQNAKAKAFVEGEFC